MRLNGRLRSWSKWVAMEGKTLCHICAFVRANDQGSLDTVKVVKVMGSFESHHVAHPPDVIALDPYLVGKVCPKRKVPDTGR